MFPSLLIFFTLLIILSPHVFSALAQSAAPAQNGAVSATSPCVLTKIGNPPANQSLPVGCSGNVSGNWPFGDRSKTMLERVDQGYDLEFDTSNATVYAVADGTINLDHGPNPCNGGTGFGNTYPIEVLNKPITVNGRTYTQIYYGHVNDTKTGPVTAGEAIAQTYDCVIEDGVYVPWLEIGFWNPGTGPVATSLGTDPSCALDPNPSATLPGCDMKQWIDSGAN